jgi:hypothetical protein
MGKQRHLSHHIKRKISLSLVLYMKQAVVIILCYNAHRPPGRGSGGGSGR